MVVLLASPDLLVMYENSTFLFAPWVGGPLLYQPAGRFVPVWFHPLVWSAPVAPASGWWIRTTPLS